MKARIISCAIVSHFILSGVRASSNTSCSCVAKNPAGTGQVNHAYPPELPRHLISFISTSSGSTGPDDVEIWRFLEAHNFEVVSTRGIALGLGSVATRLGPSEIKRRMSAMVNRAPPLGETGILNQAWNQQEPSPMGGVTTHRDSPVSSFLAAACQVTGPSGTSRAGQLAQPDDLTMDDLSLSDLSDSDGEVSKSDGQSDSGSSEEMPPPGQPATAWNLPEDYTRISSSLRRRRFAPLSNAELKRIVPRYVEVRGIAIVRRCMNNIRLDLLAVRQHAAGETTAATRGKYNSYLPYEIDALERIVELECAGALSVLERVRLESIVLKRHTEGSMKVQISRLKKSSGKKPTKTSRVSNVEDVQGEIDQSKE